ncbi:hypothetical protein BGX21_005856 [Mortierella sp. AD011]|nr:hypothetical protein BGX21_005856 [Mortierella sp. AD011]
MSSRSITPVQSTTIVAAKDWTPTSWQSKPIKQDVDYPDQAHLNKVLEKIGRLPPMVVPGEIHRLRQQLADVALGKAFLLQGGDCAELFDYCAQGPIEAKLKVLLQMSLVLVWGARMPVVRIARMAGQYAKPRSKPTEMHEGKEILSYRGDNVNGYDPNDRNPDPERLLGAYFHSAATLNYVRSIINEGFADLHHPSNWNLHHVKSATLRQEYQGIVDRLTDALDFMKTIGADPNQTGTPLSTLNTVDIFASHEGLLLEYEQALTRLMTDPADPSQRKYYNVGTHFIWIGDRTRQLDGAHVEYFRGIENPIGVKCGPSMKPEELVELLDILDADKQPGKVTLITRYGVDQVDKYLPGHIRAVQESGHVVVWACDPMHGNTKQSVSGVKTRHLIDITRELSQAIRIHKQLGSHLGGVHFELTGDRVTECVGGSMELLDAELLDRYETHCDPRLNYEQALDMAFLIAKYQEKQRGFSGMTPLNSQEKSLRITILTPFRGPGNLPAVYVTPEVPGKICGYVEFECSDEIKGGDFDLTFRVKSEARWVRNYGQTNVVYHSKQVLQRESWEIPVTHLRPGVIGAGKIRYDFEVALDPQTPSSIAGRRGWLNYRFAATLHRGFPRRNVVFKQDVWMFNTCLPAPNLEYMPDPHVYSGVWDSHLPFVCSLPSKNIALGQTVPLTVRLDPFLPSSGHFRQELVVVSAIIKLKQYTRLWHRWNVKTETKEVLAMTVNDGWPQVRSGLQRTIQVNIPPAPRLSCTTITRPVQKTHVLKLIMRVRTQSMTDREARELRVEMEVNVTGPRPPSDFLLEELPPYSTAWDGENDGDDSD